MSAVPFEAVLGLDPALAKQRRRLLTSAMLAMAVCTGAGTLTWVGDKLGVAAVSPPKTLYEVSVAMFEPVAPPKPPALPPKQIKGEQLPNETSPAVVPKATVPRETSDPPPEDVEIVPGTAKPRETGVPSGAIGSGPVGPGGFGGPAIGVGVACALPPCVISDPPRPPKPVAVDPPRKPIKSLMARAIFSPDPDPRKLATTPTGRRGGQGGKSTVDFCIDPRGRTYQVRTGQRFGGDANVDEICRQTVRRWRFRPLVVGGTPRATCTSVTFDIRFD